MTDARMFQKAIEEYDRVPDFSQSDEYISLRNEFLEKFSIKALENITIEQYALGLDATYKDSFCYWLETKLLMFGNIKGATASKFGVYYGTLGDDEENKWRWTSWTNSSFETIKEELNLLIMAGNEMDLDSIEKNRLSPMFKGKILTMYFPDRYLNVYSYEHVKYFLKQFGVVDYVSVEHAKQKLLEIKSKYPIMRDWNNLKYSNFLYWYFSEVKKKDKEEINDETPEIVGKQLSFVKSDGPYFGLKKRTVQWAANVYADDDSKAYEPDYQKAFDYKRKTGCEGELAVLKYEIELLKSNGRQDLANKVEHVSEKDDSRGFDILSFDPITGKEKHIEVKTTKASKGDIVDFYITDNELACLMMDSCYSIYYVTGIYGNNPKIKELSVKKLSENIAELSNPVLYRVKFEEGKVQHAN